MNTEEYGHMKRLTITTLLLISLASVSFSAEQPGKPARPAIYDRNADGTKQIEDALNCWASSNVPRKYGFWSPPHPCMKSAVAPG